MVYNILLGNNSETNKWWIDLYEWSTYIGHT